jgi:hypothetical protein
MDSVGWLNEQLPHDASPVELAQAAERRQDAREAHEAERREAEREAAAETRQETLELAERQFGSPLAEMSRARSAFTAADDECRDLGDKLRKAQARRSSAEGNIKFWVARQLEAERRVDVRLAQARARPASRSASPPKASAGHHGGCEICSAYAASQAQRSALGVDDLIAQGFSPEVAGLAQREIRR